jgi:hypothetical protein
VIKARPEIPFINDDRFIEQVVDAAQAWANVLTDCTPQQRDRFVVNLIMLIEMRLKAFAAGVDVEGILLTRDGEFRGILLKSDRAPNGIIAQTLKQSGIKQDLSLMSESLSTEIRLDGNVHGAHPKRTTAAKGKVLRFELP